MIQNMLRLQGGPYNGMSFVLYAWPPPERLTEENCALLNGDGGIEYQLVSQSKITDEQIATMPNVMRGALYKFVDPDGDRE